MEEIQYGSCHLSLLPALPLCLCLQQLLGVQPLAQVVNQLVPCTTKGKVVSSSRAACWSALAGLVHRCEVQLYEHVDHRG